MKSSEKNLLLKIARNLEPQEIFDKLKKGKMWRALTQRL